MVKKSDEHNLQRKEKEKTNLSVQRRALKGQENIEQSQYQLTLIFNKIYNP